jgi:hypothetical protein
MSKVPVPLGTGKRDRERNTTHQNKIDASLSRSSGTTSQEDDPLGIPSTTPTGILYPELVSARHITVQALDEMFTTHNWLGYYSDPRLEYCFLENLLGWDYTYLIGVLAVSAVAIVSFIFAARTTSSTFAESIYLLAASLTVVLVLLLVAVHWWSKQLLHRRALETVTLPRPSRQRVGDGIVDELDSELDEEVEGGLADDLEEGPLAVDQRDEDVEEGRERRAERRVSATEVKGKPSGEDAKNGNSTASKERQRRKQLHQLEGRFILLAVEVISLTGAFLLHILALTLGIGYIYLQPLERQDRVVRNSESMFLSVATGIGSFLGIVLFRHRIVLMSAGTTACSLIALIVRVSPKFDSVKRFYPRAIEGIMVSFTAIVIFAAVITAHRVSIDRRRRFERDLRGRLVANILAAKEKMVRSTLNILLPDQVFQEIVKGRMIRDSSPSCTIIVSRVADYPVWASWYLPMLASKMLEHLFHVFEDRAKLHGCSKISQSNEYYVSSCGLRNVLLDSESMTSSPRWSPLGSDPHQPGGTSHRLSGAEGGSDGEEGFQSQAIRFAELQARLANLYSARLCRLLPTGNSTSAALRMCIGVHKGQATGTLVGTRQLSYAVGGPAARGAFSLSQLATPGSVFGSSIAVEGTEFSVQKPLPPLSQAHVEGLQPNESWGIVQPTAVGARRGLAQYDARPSRAIPPTAANTTFHPRPLTSQQEEPRGSVHGSSAGSSSVRPLKVQVKDEGLPLHASNRIPVPPPTSPTTLNGAMVSRRDEDLSLQAGLRLRYLEEAVKQRQVETRALLELVANDDGTLNEDGASEVREETEGTRAGNNALPHSNPRTRGSDRLQPEFSSPFSGTSASTPSGVSPSPQLPFAEEGNKRSKVARMLCFGMLQKFPYPDLERRFWQSQSYVGRHRPDPFGRPQQPWHQMHYFFVCIAVIASTTMEMAWTPANMVLQSVASIAIFLAALLGSVWAVPVKVHFLIEAIVGALLPAATRLAGHHFLNGNVIALYVQIGFATLTPFRLMAPWWMVALKLMIFPVVELTLMHFEVGEFSRDYIQVMGISILYGPISVLLIVGAWFSERESRQSFLVLLRLQKAQREFDLAARRQRVLLGMLLPPFVADRVSFAGKGQLLDKTFVMEFPDYLLMELKCSPIAGDESGAATFDRWERMFCCLEAAFDRHLVTALVGVLHVLGDTVRLGGPMLLPQPDKGRSVGAASVTARGILSRAMKTFLPVKGSRHEREALTQTAAVGLLMALGELLSSGGEFSKSLSAYLVAEDGCGVVVGTPPSFSMVGVVSQLISALSAAAPTTADVHSVLGQDNIFMMSNKFDAILKEGLRKLTPVSNGTGIVGGHTNPPNTVDLGLVGREVEEVELPRPFARGSESKWRLRGVGYVNLVQLLVQL